MLVVLHVLCLSSWCLVIVVWLFLTMTRVCLQFVIVVFPDHTHSLFCFSLLLLFIYFVCDLPYCLSVSGLLVFRILLLFIILV